MSKAPERIWINKVHGLHPEDWDFTDGAHLTKAQLRQKVEYVRADRIEALKDKLAKAVEALDDISSNGNAAGRNPQLMADKARDTLAELKGVWAIGNGKGGNWGSLNALSHLCGGTEYVRADRIEQLKHRLFQCATDLQVYRDAFAVSEAKLAKAVDAINVATQCEPRGLYPDHVPNYWLLRTTLAEIKLQSSEFATQKGESRD